MSTAPPLTNRLKVLLIAATVCAVAALSLGLFTPLERLYLGQIAKREAATLRLAVEGLNGSLQRFEALPKLIAERPEIARALRDTENSALIAGTNAYLRGTAQAVGLSDIFLINRDGLTVAASNSWKERSFVGRNFAYRPYFQDAIAGRQGRFFALGTTSGERGYFFAEAVRDGPRILGVLAVKFTVEDFERAWADGPNEIIVQDQAGVIFMASRADWHFRFPDPLEPGELERIKVTRQYPMDQLTQLPVQHEPFGDGLDRLSVRPDGGPEESFVVQSLNIPDAGWRVSLFSPAEPARAQALGSVATIGLVAVLFGLVATVVLQRRARLRERMRAAEVMQVELERRVTERTAELAQEVEDRRAAEALLRKTQTELVQAGKLAALGQMAAALSHEFNQPLTAVKSFAQNAVAYFDRGQPEKARANVGLINDMVDRLASISTHLRNFARRPGEKTEAIRLNQSLDSALAILEPKMRAAGVRVDRAPLEEDIWVLGGQVRLQQVLVNLLSNAVDAMADVPDPVVSVAVDLTLQEARVTVRDRGPGMTQDDIYQLFDPFFTTKAPGKGLGLGLSISYNIVRDFGGSLEGANHAEGGAVFSVTLRLAETAAEIAAEAAE